VHEALQERWLRSRRLGPDALARMDRKRLLRRWFDELDDDGSGEISGDELLKPLLSAGVVTSAEEFDAMVAPFDVNGNGQLDFHEFSQMLCGDHSDPRTRQLLDLMEMHMRGELGGGGGGGELVLRGREPVLAARGAAGGAGPGARRGPPRPARPGK